MTSWIDVVRHGRIGAAVLQPSPLERHLAGSRTYTAVFAARTEKRFRDSPPRCRRPASNLQNNLPTEAKAMG
ncbi:MAG: hypothetical protein ACTH2X_03365, partial [Brachybacterium tyrofermentans]